MAALVWAWQGGTAGVDQFLAARMGSDGSSVLAGMADKTTIAVDLTTYWTAVKFDADGDVLWTWQDDTTGDEDDILRAADMDGDGFVVLAGSGANNFQVIKLDPDGGEVWRFQEGSESTDYADGIALGDDGSMVVGGATNGEWDIPNLGSPDMAAFKLDANGTLIWKWQGGTTSYEVASDVAMAEDGSAVLSGKSQGDFTGVDASSSSSSSPDFEYTFAAIKLDSEGAEVWRWQDGPKTEDTRLGASTVTEDGYFVLVGQSDGIWSGSASAGGVDFAAVKLDADGNEVCRWQDGTSEDDKMADVTVQADGTIVLGGYTKGDWIGTNAGGDDFAIVALDANLEEIWWWQHGAGAFGDYVGTDYMAGISAGPDGRIVFGGNTYGSYAETNLGMGDLVAVMLDTNALATPSPTTSVSSAAAPTPPAATTPSPSSPATPATGPGPAPTPTSNTSPTTPPAPPAPTSVPSPAAMPPESSSTTQGASNVAPIAAGVASAVVGATLIALGLCLLKRKHDKTSGTAQQVHPPVAAVDRGNGPPMFQLNPAPEPPPYLYPAAGGQQPSAPPPPSYLTSIGARQQTTSLPPPPYQHAVARAATAATGAPAVADVGGGGTDHISRFPASLAGVVRHGAEPTKQAGKHDGGRSSLTKEDAERTTHAGRYSGGSGVESKGGQPELTKHVNNMSGGRGGDGWVGLGEGDLKGGPSDPALIITTSTDNVSTGERIGFTPAYDGDPAVRAAFVAEEPKPTFDETGAFSSTDGRGSTAPPGLGRAVGEAALELARNCLIPGVSEAAAAVSILVELLAGNQDTKNNTEPSLRRCRSIVLMLQRAAKVLGKGGDTTGKAERAMMEDVHDAIFDLVELIKTYQSKNRLSQLLMSTLFRRRQDEMGAVVDRAILSLQLGLQVQVGNDVSAFKDDMHLYKGSMEEAQSKSLAEARRSRRQRKLDKIEIPEDHVTITDELLGKGGFGEVYLADYNGRNSAAKVLYISNDPEKRGENDIVDGSAGERIKGQREKSQRKSFLLELDAMIRLRSPYTVNVYGAVTSMPDRLILVMELLSGGDLRTLLGSCESPLPEQQSRQIIGDICAGMAFLHSKEAVHGDLKSANVLLDGAGRAKIGDFGTSRWTQHTMSTGLATFTANSSKSTHMSLAWSAPEVLHASGSTYASDIYSFGIVVWEVLSRELPWANVTNPKEIFIRVVLNGLRPAMPHDAPADIADVAKACWVDNPGNRPSFSVIMQTMKANGCNQ